MEKAHVGTFLITQAKLPTSTTSSAAQVPDMYEKNLESGFSSSRQYLARDLKPELPSEVVPNF